MSHFSWLGAYLAIGVALRWFEGFDEADRRRRFADLRACVPAAAWPAYRTLAWLALGAGVAAYVALWPAILAARIAQGRFRA